MMLPGRGELFGIRGLRTCTQMMDGSKEDKIKNDTINRDKVIEDVIDTCMNINRINRCHEGNRFWKLTITAEED